MLLESDASHDHYSNLLMELFAFSLCEKNMRTEGGRGRLCLYDWIKTNGDHMA